MTSSAPGSRLSVLSGQHELEAELRRIGTDSYCVDPLDLIEEARSLLLPPEKISTTECAARYRYLPNPEGTGKRLWDPELTPYICGIQDALDDPNVRAVIVPKPGRVGGTVAGENHLFKRLRHGPMTDTLIYLPGKSDVDSYADTVFAPFFDLHPEIAAKLGKRTTDNKRTFKRLGRRYIELLPANLNTVRGRQAPYIMADEVDGYRPALRGNFKQQADIRGRAYGSQRKLYMCSHMDLGWSGGVAPAWKESNRGLWYWHCPECSGASCPSPLAPKGMHMRLSYERPEGMDGDELLDHVEATAGMRCPHCDAVIKNDLKQQMLDSGFWAFEGQVVAPDGTITGEIRPNETWGFWIHGTMSPFVDWGKLAREYVAALVFYERTRKPERLKEVTVKSLGEVYEGAGAGSRVLSPDSLKQRAGADAMGGGCRAGTVPDGVMYLTAAVDVGAHKFDVKIKGWDLETRSWVIDRFTLLVNDKGRKLDLYNRQEDWLVLRDELLRRVVPFASDSTMGLKIAGIAIDNSDGHVTWKAREFARQMVLAKESGEKGYRLRLIKGESSKTKPEVSDGKIINRDDQGRAIEPGVPEFILNVDKLKTIVVDRLAIDEDGPGYVRWAVDLPAAEFTELCGEVLIDGKWERRGPNESLDLEAYNEAVRIKLAPDRPEINWNLRPQWARPERVPGADDGGPTAAKPKKKSYAERMAALNQAA